LVDSLSSAEFDAKLLSLRDGWDDRERSARKTKEPKFFAYFNRNIAVSMKEKMLIEIRRKAGLGDNFFYNNASESMNDRIKKRIRQTKQDSNPSGHTDVNCTLSEMVKVYKEVVDECRRNIQRAIIDLGPYRLDDSVSHFKVAPERWRDMTESERKQCLKKED